MMRTTTTSVPRATALLLALLELLQREWTLYTDADTDAAALHAQLLQLGVSAAPSVRFVTSLPVSSASTIDVRGLAIGDKLFVHFVAQEEAVRLDLRLAEYTKEDATGAVVVDARTHKREAQWIINTEVLQWRLERTVFPVFRGTEPRAYAAASAGAELGRLPEPLLLRIAPFLTGKEYCGMTQTNKFLNEYANQETIWKSYVTKEFPDGTHTTNERTAKAIYVTLHGRDKRRIDAVRRVWDSLPGPSMPPGSLRDPFYGRPRPFFLPHAPQYQLPRPDDEMRAAFPRHPHSLFDEDDDELRVPRDRDNEGRNGVHNFRFF